MFPGFLFLLLDVSFEHVPDSWVFVSPPNRFPRLVVDLWIVKHLSIFPNTSKVRPKHRGCHRRSWTAFRCMAVWPFPVPWVRLIVPWCNFSPSVAWLVSNKTKLGVMGVCVPKGGGYIKEFLLGCLKGESADGSGNLVVVFGGISDLDLRLESGILR